METITDENYAYHDQHCRQTLETALRLAAEGFLVFPIVYLDKVRPAKSRGVSRCQRQSGDDQAMVRRHL